MTIDILLEELRDVNFITLSCDASNKGNFKALPVMVRYFSHVTGSQSKLVDVFQLDDETGETLFTKLKLVWEKYDLHSKVKAFMADNAKENFGGLTRGGEKNVFRRLQDEFDNLLIGAGCIAHLVHKSAEKGCDKFQPFFDIEATVINIYNYFKSSSTRSARLRELIDADDYIKLLGYANTRFIGFRNCIHRIIMYFDDLRTFFDAEKSIPESLSRFFDHPLAKLLLIFVRDQCQYFEAVIRSVEGSHVSAYEGAQKIFSLIASIRERIDEQFTTIEFQQELTNIAEELPFTDTILRKVGKRSVPEEICIDHQYINGMVQNFQSKFLQ